MVLLGVWCVTGLESGVGGVEEEADESVEGGGNDEVHGRVFPMVFEQESPRLVAERYG